MDHCIRGINCQPQFVEKSQQDLPRAPFSHPNLCRNIAQHCSLRERPGQTLKQLETRQKRDHQDPLITYCKTLYSTDLITPFRFLGSCLRIALSALLRTLSLPFRHPTLKRSLLLKLGHLFNVTWKTTEDSKKAPLLRLAFEGTSVGQKWKNYQQLVKNMCSVYN